MESFPFCRAARLAFLALASTASTVPVWASGVPAEGTEVTAPQMIEAFEGTFGVHPGQRRNHIKGTCAAGEFVGSADTAALSRSALFSGKSIPVVARFSLGGGSPEVPDAAPAPRGMALEFHLPDGALQHITMIDAPIFAAASPASFRDLLVAAKPDPKTGQPDPEKLKVYAATHPDAMALTQLSSHHTPTANYYQSTYFSIHTFKFIDAKGAEHLVKWRFVPRDGTKEMTAAEMKAAPHDFLEKNLIERTRNAPVVWDMIVYVGEPGDPQEGAPKWFEIDKLRADVDSKTDRLNAGKLSRETVGGNHLIEIDAELILFQPSRNFGVGARVDVRIDPDRDRRDPASCAGDLAQLAQLRHRLDVDLVDLGVERRLELGSGLAHPREKDPLRRHTGGESAAQLAFRDDIGTGPEAGEEAQDGEVGVGLDRIADQRPLCGESLGKTLVLGGEGSCRIEVAGSADGSRDPRNRDPFGVQLIAAIGKEITHSDRDGERCWAHRAGGPADLSCRSPSARGRGWRRAVRRRQRAASPSPASLRSAPSPALRERGDPAQGAGWVRAAPHV